MKKIIKSSIVVAVLVTMLLLAVPIASADVKCGENRSNSGSPTSTACSVTVNSYEYFYCEGYVREQRESIIDDYHIWSRITADSGESACGMTMTNDCKFLYTDWVKQFENGFELPPNIYSGNVISESQYGSSSAPYTAYVGGGGPDPDPNPGKKIAFFSRDKTPIFNLGDIGIYGDIRNPIGGGFGDIQLGELPGGISCINELISPGWQPILIRNTPTSIYHEYDINVSNPFDTPIIVNLSIYGVPTGWDAYLSNNFIILDPDQYMTVILTVVIPVDTTITNTILWVIGTIAEYDILLQFGIDVIVGAVPVAIANVSSDYSIILENDVLLCAASGSYDPDGTIISYDWGFGDGTSGTGVTLEHSYSSAGAYTVTLTVTDNQYLINTITVDVVVERHSFEISISPELQLCPGETANYTVTVINTGTINDTYDLTMITDTDNSWFYFPTTSVAVSVGNSAAVLLSITPPSDILLMYNTTYIFTITATCNHNSDEMSNAPLIYTADETLIVIATKESKTRYMINEVENLIVVLDSMDIQTGVKNSLQNKLENALDKLNTALDDILNGDENHADNMLNCAQNKINAFINEVEAQRGKKISEEDADTLTSTAQTIIEHIDDAIATSL